MKQAIFYEVLFFTNSRFPKKHSCQKKCNKDASACPLQLHHAVSQGNVLLNRLYNHEGHASMRDIAPPVRVTPAKNFIQLEIGGQSGVNEGYQAVSPHSFLPLKNFN
jgi:hypothetical protein